MAKRIVIGADPSGFDLKESVKKHLAEIGYEVEDVGMLSVDAPVDYYQVGANVAEKISKKEFEQGLLFCGSGMGVSIVANKFPGVYCGLCESVMSARLCKIINNCNILSMGGFFIAPTMGNMMVDAFLEAEFTQGFPPADPAFLKGAYCAIQENEKDWMK